MRVIELIVPELFCTFFAAFVPALVSLVAVLERDEVILVDVFWGDDEACLVSIQLSFHKFVVR